MASACPQTSDPPPPSWVRREENVYARKLLPNASRVAFVVIFFLLFIGGIELHPGPFPCKRCSAVPETIGSSLLHQRVHSNSSNFLYDCPVPTCSFNSKSYNFAQKHLSVFHREERHEDPSSEDVHLCSVILGGIPCSHSASSVVKLVHHLYTHIESGVSVNCAFTDCQFPKSFSKKSTFQSHLSLYHPDWRAEGCPKKRVLKETSSKQQTEGDSVQYPNVEEPPSMDFEEAPQPNEIDGDNLYLLEDQFVLDSVAEFYLKMYALHLLPYETIQELCDGLALLTEIMQARIKLVLAAELTKWKLSETEINELCHKVQAADLLFTSHHKNNAGASLYTDNFRKKYFTNHFGYTPPSEKNLNPNDPESGLRQINIPVKDTLLMLFKDVSVCKDIDKSFQRSSDEARNGIVKDYHEGSLFLSEIHPAKEIQLFVYMDAINVVMNPLGSAKNKFKLLAKYFTIGNLKPHHRSKVRTKHLMMLMKESVFKEVGPDVSLEEVMNQLEELERDGIIYKGEQVPVVVEFILGDNLGQHSIGGFTESFSVNYFCRFCPIQRPHFKSDPAHTEPQRTVADYNNCVNRAEVSGNLVKGVKRDCVYNKLKNIHATSHLAPCLGHDLFEGTVSWDLAGIIERFVKKKKWFSYKLLNKRIKDFKCKESDIPNKPAFVSAKGKKLGGHAVQNWTLLRLLPFLISDKIQDFEDKGWKLYLKLKELCEYFVAPCFSKLDMAIVKDVLIPPYYDLRAKVLNCDEYPLYPKYHFMTHYAELMLRFGPLIHLWTLPFEQKHKFFKSVLRLTKNFINPEFTCAVRYQLSMCYENSGVMFPEGWSEVGAKAFLPNSYSGQLASFLNASFKEPSNWRDCSNVSIAGLTYSKGQVLILSPADSKNVYCGVIKLIVCNGLNINLVLEKLKADYNEILGIFEMPPDAHGSLCSISPESLEYPNPVPVYYFKTKQCFSLKYGPLKIDVDANVEDFL